MDWFTGIVVLDVFFLVVLPYIIYSSIYVMLRPRMEADLIYHFLVMSHGILMVLYLQWIPLESARFRGFWLWKWAREHYFKFQVTDPDGNLKSTDQMIVAIHPHGIYPVALDAYFACNGDMIRFKPVATSILFKVPLLKEFAGLAGAIPANRSDMLTALNCKDSLVLAPGGIREVFGDPPIIKRLGFLRIAMSAQVPVVPVWSTGEVGSYSLWLPFPRLQQWILSTFWIPVAIFSWGNPWIPLWPKRRPYEIRVGKRLNPKDFKDEHALYDAFYAEIDRLSK